MFMFNVDWFILVTVLDTKSSWNSVGIFEKTMPPGSCQPHRHVYFLKVPKTGSSTFTGMLNRLILRHNLTAYDKRSAKTTNVFSKFDAHAIHGIFNHEIAQKVMKADTIYVATMRHPFLHYRSKFLFEFREKNLLTVQTEMEKAITESYFDKSKNKYVFSGFKIFENPTLQYFGFDYEHALLNNSYFKECMDNITDLFHIIITEYFDESVLLLNEKLCWDIKDVLFLTHKNASYYGKEKLPVDYGVLYERHQNISHLDYVLYDHFLKRHKQKVMNAGKEFQEKLSLFREMKDSANAFCFRIFEELMHSPDKSTSFHVVMAQQHTINGNKFFNSVRIGGKDCVASFVCDGQIRYAVRALNYPILCKDTDNIFCKDDSIPKKETFQYKNLYFPLSKLKKLISCDMILQYQ